MPLSWNEIKSRALTFSREWAGERSERAEAKTFWDGFFQIFGVTRRRLAAFEAPVKKVGNAQGFIDLFWKGVLIVEHKSRGQPLERAYAQALDYFPGIRERDLPQYILVSDFARLRLYDLVENEQHEFALEDLHQEVHRFGFIAGYQIHKIKEQDPVNIEAAQRMGRLHDQMKAAGYAGHALELYLVRLLFCLFAEDTGIFGERQQFQNYIEERTHEDGSDLAQHLAALFQTLNTPAGLRLKNLDEQLAAFPYVNGKLFEEMLPQAGFDAAMRQSLLDCCALDWSRISPAIFGSLFQSIMDRDARRDLGAHYTSETNILKLIKPLFLDALWAEFAKIKHSRNKLFEFHKKLRTLTFLDPACGCGNFLVIAYRELRLLELAVLRASRGSQQQNLDVHALIALNVDQFHGIEIEEFPAQIAQVALWLVDHQMNLRVSEEFGTYFTRIPLATSPHIHHANALTLDWNAVIPAPRLSYLLGNPPFVGKQYQNAAQKADMAATLGDLKGAGVLDYVCCWYRKAADIMTINPAIRSAFVSTNSITQGEQVSVLWAWLFSRGVHITFAHRTFQWFNEARGKAAVHCVIIGFALQDAAPKRLFEYGSPQSEPHEVSASSINPYLVDAEPVVLENRRQPICPAPAMVFGSMPNDGGHLLLSEAEKRELIKREPAARPWLRPYLGAEEFINNQRRWCLWLADISPAELRQMPELMRRIEAVKAHRRASARATTQALAATPTLFGEIRQPTKGHYLLLPRVSSERRAFVPIGFLTHKTIAGDACLIIPAASIYHFGILTSTLHNAWMRAVAGRLESRYRYSAGIVYNNFPWPHSPTEKQKHAIEVAAQSVLDARAAFPDSTLADLYDPQAMPPLLTRAHQKLDRAVDAAYRKTAFDSEAERVKFLFALYQQYTTLPLNKPKTSRSRA